MQNRGQITLLEIEDNPKLLNYLTYDNVPIWMIGRYYLLYNIAGAMLYEYSPQVRRRRMSFQMIKNINQTLFYNLKNRNILHKKKLILCAINRKTVVDGKYFNRYVDFFKEIYPNEAAVIEQPLMEWEWPFPRYMNDVYFETIGKINGEIVSHLFWKRDYKETEKLVRLFNLNLFQKSGLKLSEKEIVLCTKHICQLIVAMRFQSKWIEKHITKDVKMIITVGAGFPHSCFTNLMLKKYGIISVELQHGYITKNNIMYNYHQNIVNDQRVKNGLPEYALTYGNWWNNEMNCPVKKVAIGNPYRDMAVKTYQTKKLDNSIVILGIGENTEKYIDLTYFLSQSLDGYSIKYRPHPGESYLAKKIVKKKQIIIEIDMEPEIYKSLCTTSVIVGEVTTVLFEAIGICNRIIVWNMDYSKAYLPVHPFEKFEEEEELVRLLKKKSNVIRSTEDFWATDWQNNFKRFIEQTIGNCT